MRELGFSVQSIIIIFFLLFFLLIVFVLGKIMKEMLITNTRLIISKRENCLQKCLRPKAYK